MVFYSSYCGHCQSVLYELQEGPYKSYYDQLPIEMINLHSSPTDQRSDTQKLQSAEYQSLLEHVPGTPCIFVSQKDEHGHWKKVMEIESLIGAPSNKKELRDRLTEMAKACPSS